MSKTYPHYPYSDFPNNLDKQMEIRDPSESDSILIKQYTSLINDGQHAAAKAILVANPQLLESQMNAEKLLRIHHSILALQEFFKDKVLDQIYRLGSQRGAWTPTMSSNAENENDRLYLYDVVRYPVDGVNQYFLVHANDIVAGEIPTETDKYIQLSIKGDKFVYEDFTEEQLASLKGAKGDKGDAFTFDMFTAEQLLSIKGEQGVSGLGMSPRGAWVNNKDFYQYDVVSHNGYLWYCIEDNLATEPSDDSTIWKKFNISMQSAVGTDVPANLEEGGIWLHTQEDGHVVIKTMNTSGEYISLYPETNAMYITDANGESLQRKLYKHYFERDDVKVKYIDNDPVYTTEARLLSTNVVVAKLVFTDNFDDKGTATEEMTIYSETGDGSVLYKCKRTFTDNGDDTYECIPEILM